MSVIGRELYSCNAKGESGAVSLCLFHDVNFGPGTSMDNLICRKYWCE